VSGLLELREITRTFTVPDSEPLQILTGVNLSVSPGEHVAIVGRSGTGKSTLLNILGLIDKPTSGSRRSAPAGGRGDSPRAGRCRCPRACSGPMSAYR